MTKEEILQNCTVEGNIVKLPSGQLERKLYQEVAKALTLIGGTWRGGKIMGFVFHTDPTELLERIANGEKIDLKKEYQFFATPEPLAGRLVDIACVLEYHSVLEPSAGQGAIIKAINKVVKAVPDCYELMDINRVILNKSGLRFNLIGDNFLKHVGKMYHRIIANPPFSNNQDIDHLMEMYKYLEDGGRLVCITSDSWVRGSQKKQVYFREWLDNLDHEVVILETGTFKESGTMVGGRIVIIDK